MNQTPYLSSREQIEQERFAADIFAHPTLQAAVEQLARSDKPYAPSQTPAGRATWGRAVRNYAFSYVVRYANADPEFPTVLWDQNSAVQRDGMEIPSSCCMGNNPDNIYRRIALDPAHRYVITGRRRDPISTDANISTMPHFTLEGGWRQQTLDAHQIVADAQGRFEITLSAEDGGGAANHLRLDPGVVRLTLRDTMLDWAEEYPMEFHVRRIGQSGARPRHVADMAERLAGEMGQYFDYYLSFNDRVIYSRPLNVLKSPVPTPTGLASQLSALGHYGLEDDQALVIELDRLGARYLAFQLCDPWMVGMEYRGRTGSLNAHQAVADGDGRLRLVVSASDPGVHNWIDTEGVRAGIMITRWQGLPADLKMPEHPAVTTRVVSLSALGSVLPGDTRWLSPGERPAQLRTREASHARRFTL